MMKAISNMVFRYALYMHNKGLVSILFVSALTNSYQLRKITKHKKEIRLCVEKESIPELVYYVRLKHNIELVIYKSKHRLKKHAVTWSI